MNAGKNYQGDSHTFVVCAYRESPYLEACVRSVLRQTVKSHVCIATSTPNEWIAGIAETYRLPVFVRQKGESRIQQDGIAVDWNFAADCANTPLVTLAHQDDVYEAHYTQCILQVLNRCSHPLLAFTDYYELRNGETVKRNRLLRIKRLLLSPLKLHLFWKSRFVRRRILSLGSAICCPSVTMVKPHLSLPVFENNMKSNIDWQAWEKISRQKGEFAYVDRACLLHRIHAESTTSELLENSARIEEDLKVYRKFWPEPVARLLERFYRKSEESNRLS